MMTKSNTAQSAGGEGRASQTQSPNLSEESASEEEESANSEVREGEHQSKGIPTRESTSLKANGFREHPASV